MGPAGHAFDRPTVGDRHRRIDPAEWAETYVVGDVHGCLTELDALLERIDPSGDDLLLFVGDLVRKGPDSAGVLDRIRSLPNAHTVLGNNEAKLLRGEEDLDALGEDDLEFLASLPLAITCSSNLVVHGGVDPAVPLADQTPEALLTRRGLEPGAGYGGPFWFEAYEGPPRVFFGHTVTRSVIEFEHAVGLDTGCVYGGELTAYRLGDGETVTVESTREEWNRDDDQILQPDDLTATEEWSAPTGATDRPQRDHGGTDD